MIRVLAHPLTLSVILTLTFLPLFVFRYLPFREVLSLKQRRILLLTSGGLLLVNTAAAAMLFSYAAVTRDADLILFLKIDIAVYYLLSLFPFLLISRHYRREVLFVSGTMGIFALLMLSTGLFILNYLPVHGLIALGLLCGILLVIAALCAYYIYNTFKKTVTPFLGNVQPQYWRNIWLVPNAMLAAMIFTVPLKTFDASLPQLVSRLLIGLATVQMCRSVAYDYQLLEQRLQLDSQITAQKEYYAALHGKMEADRRARHDFQHQLAAIQAMAQKGDTASIEDYCLSLTATTKGDYIPFVGNAALDGLLYRFSQRCKEAGVPLDIRGFFKPQSDAELDVCVALGNALDNALAATKTLPPDKRFIDVELLPEGPLFSATVKNSFDGIVKTDQNGALFSKKRGNEQTGYGLASMDAVCKAHGGTMTVHYDDESFAVMMLMNINE